MFEREFEGGSEDADGGIAHHDIHMVEYEPKRGERFGKAFRVTDISLDGESPVAQSAYGRTNLFDLFVAVMIHEGDIATSAGQFQGNGPAYAAGSSRDKCDSACKCSTHTSD